jgi:hypothetical protein
MTLTQILQKIKTVVYTKSQIDSMGGGTSLDTTIKSKANITDLLPIGSYIQFAGSQAPAGFLVCNGGEISRTTYSALFAVIGTTYGSGDGSTTFNLPNLTDRFLQGSTTSGTFKNAGLPNITGSLHGGVNIRDAGENSAIFYETSGAFYNDRFYDSTVVRFSTWASGGGDRGAAVINASRSSSIYGNSSTVQPPALTCLICIKY